MNDRMGKSLGAVTKVANGGTDVKGDALPTIVGGIINTAIGVMGVLLLVYVIYGGYLWMTAQGEKDKVDKARGVITNAIIGMIIISLSFAISSYVIEKVNCSVSGSCAEPVAPAPTTPVAP